MKEEERGVLSWTEMWADPEGSAGLLTLKSFLCNAPDKLGKYASTVGRRTYRKEK